MYLTKREQELNKQKVIVKTDYCLWDEKTYWRLWNETTADWYDEKERWFYTFESASKEADYINGVYERPY